VQGCTPVKSGLRDQFDLITWSPVIGEKPCSLVTSTLNKYSGTTHKWRLNKESLPLSLGIGL